MGLSVISLPMEPNENNMMRSHLFDMAVLRAEWSLASESIGVARTLFWLLVFVAMRIPRMCAKRVAVWLRLRPVPTTAPHQQLAMSFPKGNHDFRVMFCSSDNSAGSGAFRSMAALASLLKNRHHIKSLVVLPHPGDGTELLDEAKIPYILVPSCTWTVPLDIDTRKARNSRTMVSSILVNHGAIRKLTKLILAYGVDIVHVNTTWTYVGALAAKKCGVPCVWHLREFLEEDQGRTIWSRQAGSRIMANADRVVAISASIQRKYRDVISPDRLVTILNGIDTGLYFRPNHAVFEKKPYEFVFLGNFRKHKGHVEFSKACASLYRDGCRMFRVCFVGGGDKDVRDECDRIFVRTGMQNIVSYLGFQKHPEVFLEKADVAFMCSKSEAFGRVTVEAMMAGCLVIGAATAGTLELITDGETGLLFEYEESGFTNLAEKMKEAIDNPNRSRRIAEAGRSFAVEHFTAERNAYEIAELYRGLISDRAGAIQA